MQPSFRESLWKQFGATIDMLENAIVMCPPEAWNTEQLFWYNAYHCLFFLIYNLTLNPKKFSPQAPFTLSEFDPEGAMPDRVYDKELLLNYLQASRIKCHDLIKNLSDEQFHDRWVDYYKDVSVFEFLIHSLRHVQHHTAQLNLLLRQMINNAPRWVAQAKMDL